MWLRPGRVPERSCRQRQRARGKAVPTRRSRRTGAEYLFHATWVKLQCQGRATNYGHHALKSLCQDFYYSRARDALAKLYPDVFETLPIPCLVLAATAVSLSAVACQSESRTNACARLLMRLTNIAMAASCQRSSKVRRTLQHIRRLRSARKKC